MSTSNSPGNPEMFQQLGSITRQLHDALKELGYADKLKGTVDQLPDAQSRLSYIARLTGEATMRVGHVDRSRLVPHVHQVEIDVERGVEDRHDVIARKREHSPTPQASESLDRDVGAAQRLAHGILSPWG